MACFQQRIWYQDNMTLLYIVYLFQLSNRCGFKKINELY